MSDFFTRGTVVLLFIIWVFFGAAALMYESRWWSLMAGLFGFLAAFGIGWRMGGSNDR